MLPGPPSSSSTLCIAQDSSICSSLCLHLGIFFNSHLISGRVEWRLVPTGISTWSAQTWQVLTVAVIMVSVTTWGISRKRGCERPGCEGRGSSALELLLQVMILAPTMLLCCWGSSCPEPLRAVGADRPTVAVPGDSVELRCRAVTYTQAGSLGLEWRNLRTRDVILACGEDGGECRAYREGAWLLDGQREAGDLSLRLDRVRVTDAGRYRCTIFTGTHSSAALMDLSVVVLGTKPVISVECLSDSTLLYSCGSSGWFPEPALVWKSSDGTSLLPWSNVSRTRGEGGLYGLEIQYWAQHHVPDSVICIIRNTVTNGKMVSAARTSDLLCRAQVRVGETDCTKPESARESEPGGAKGVGQLKKGD